MIAYCRSGEAPSVKNSRGSGMYDDGEVSLQQPPADPGDQMLEDSQEMLQDADALLSNRYAYILRGVKPAICCLFQNIWPWSGCCCSAL